MKRGPRRLTAGEIAIWREVTRTVAPLAGVVAEDPAPRAEAPPDTPPPAPAPSRKAVPRPSAASYSPPLPAAPAAPAPGPFERRFKRRVAGGRIDIDRALDLHGLTQAQAHVALRAFLLDAQDRGARLVLVVTGKGRGGGASALGDAAPGVLRRAVPLWLHEASLRGVVSGYEAAAQPHGGEGALYIRLRRASRA